MLLKNAYVLNDDFEFKQEDLRIENGVFAEIGNIKGDGIDAEGDYIIPGLIDIHMHGSVFCNCEDDNETSLKKIAEYQASIGTTTFLASYSSIDHDTLIRAVKRAVQAHEKNFDGAHIAGIHMEGPYISKKYCGAMNLDNIRNPDDKEINEVLDIAGDLLKIVSLAPENEGAMEFIDKYKDRFAISMAHTDADFEIGKRAIELGASNVTHTFNAMRPLHHRSPNMLGAAFNSNVFMELICDGYHVHPEMVKIAYKLCGADRLVLITDSLAAAGAKDGVYHESGLEIFVKNGKAALANGAIAGGTTPLIKCVRNLVSFGVPVNKAVKCASINPARAARIDDKYGSITVGKSADCLIVDKELNLKSVIVGGKEIKNIIK